MRNDVTHCLRKDMQRHFFMFCVYGSFAASGFALAVVCYLSSDVMMLKTAVKVC